MKATESPIQCLSDQELIPELRAGAHRDAIGHCSELMRKAADRLEELTSRTPMWVGIDHAKPEIREGMMVTHPTFGAGRVKSLGIKDGVPAAWIECYGIIHFEPLHILTPFTAEMGGPEDAFSPVDPGEAKEVIAAVQEKSGFKIGDSVMVLWRPDGEEGPEIENPGCVRDVCLPDRRVRVELAGGYRTWVSLDRIRHDSSPAAVNGCVEKPEHWEVTPELRWMDYRWGNPVLQQKSRNAVTLETRWADVPTEGGVL